MARILLKTEKQSFRFCFNVYFYELDIGNTKISVYSSFMSQKAYCNFFFFKFVFYCWNLCLSNLGIGFDYFDCSTTGISHKAAASPDSGYIGSGGKKTWNRHNSNPISSKIKIVQDILDRRWRKHGIDRIQNIFYQKKK